MIIDKGHYYGNFSITFSPNCTEVELQPNILLQVSGVSFAALFVVAIVATIWYVCERRRIAKLRQKQGRQIVMLRGQPGFSTIVPDLPHMCPASSSSAAGWSFAGGWAKGLLESWMCLLDGKHKVAVKELKDTAGFTDYRNFLEELKVMLTIGQHEHIIRLLGYVNDDGKCCAPCAVLPCCLRRVSVVA